MTRGSVMDYLKAIRERYLRAGAVRNGEGESDELGRRSQRRSPRTRVIAVRNGGRQLSACCTKGRLCLARSDGEAGDGMVLR